MGEGRDKESCDAQLRRVSEGEGEVEGGCATDQLVLELQQ